MYTKLTLKKKNANKRGIPTAPYQIVYESLRKDTTGLGGTWSGSGSLVDIYRVQETYWVGLSPLNMKPIFVFRTMEEIAEFCEIEFSCPLTTTDL